MLPGVIPTLRNWWTSANENNTQGLPLKNFGNTNIEDPNYQEVYLSSYNEGDSNSTIKNNILMVKDKDGNLTYAKSKYLAMYLTSENAIYLLRNSHMALGGEFLESIGLQGKGSGLVYFVDPKNEKVSTYINTNGKNLSFIDLDGLFGNSNPYKKVRIYRNNRTMAISNANDGIFTSSSYVYNLDGWASKYGVPLQLSLALHLSTLAPDFAYEVAERGATETVVEMALVKNNDVSVNCVLNLDLGNGEQYYTVTKNKDNYTLTSEDDSEISFTSKTIPDSLRNALSKIIPISDEKEEGEEITNTDKSIVNFLDSVLGLKINKDDFIKRIPLILNVKNHWYQDISFEGCYEWIDTGNSQAQYNTYKPTNSDKQIIKNASQNGLIYIKETSQGYLTQVNDAKRVGMAGEWIKNLIDNNEYYKYDGATKSEETSKIDFKNSAVDAIAMLEQIQGDDAQDIIHMFKELMASYDIYFETTEGTEEKKELFEEIIRDYHGKLLTDGEDCVYKADIPPTQNGFDIDEIVQMPCNGKITYRTDNAVCIEIYEPDKTYNNYTILISGFKVNDSIFVDTELQKGSELGKTLMQDLKMVLRDENGAIVKNDTVIVTDEDNDGEYNTVDEQTALMYGYTQDELNTLYAIIAQEGGTRETLEARAVTTCMMLRAIRGNMHTQDGTHYSAYKAATVLNQFEAYGNGTGDYKKYLPGGNSYSYVNEQFKSAVNSVLGATSEEQLFHNYYFFVGKNSLDSALRACRPGTTPKQFVPGQGNWYYNT